MLRKIRRNAAKFAMRGKGISLFKKYTTVTTPVLNKRTGHIEEREVSRSFFAMNWRKYSADFIDVLQGRPLYTPLPRKFGKAMLS